VTEAWLEKWGNAVDAEEEAALCLFHPLLLFLFPVDSFHCQQTNHPRFQASILVVVPLVDRLARKFFLVKSLGSRARPQYSM
jgi:hypothetical protein